MILFYNKQTGEIVGTIEGRITEDHHLNSYLGSEDENGRIICNWKLVREWVDEEGDARQDWEPDHPQKDIFKELDMRPSKAYEYKVDINTGQLIKKSL